jgi:hypothetical protein
VAPTGNPAYALRNILRAVMGSNGQTVAQGWATVLHAERGSLQFAQRHGEVVGLFNRVYELLLALPADVEGRGQYMEYLPTWYEAVVYQLEWGSINRPASGLGDTQAISQLTGLGMAFELHALATPRPSDEALARLKASLDEWDALLDELEIDERLVSELRASVNRLRFLLEDEVLLTFGTEPVVAASKDLAGSALSAFWRTTPQIAKKIAVVAGAALAILHGAHTAVDDANGFLEGVQTLSTRVIELTQPQKEVEAPKTKELPAGKTVDTHVQRDENSDGGHASDGSRPDDSKSEQEPEG